MTSSISFFPIQPQKQKAATSLLPNPKSNTINSQHSLSHFPLTYFLTHHSTPPPPRHRRRPCENLPTFIPKQTKTSMGCCFSTNKSPPSNKTGHISNSKTTTTKRGGVSKSPPPSNPLLEEETVKEVLSETPAAAKPPTPPIPKFQSKQESPFIKSAPLLQDKDRQNGAVSKARYLAFAGDDLSEASEICSTLSESVSASTSVTEKRENNGDRRAELRDQRQRSPARLRNRQFSGEMLREKTVGRSPARRCEPSPGRARPVPASGYGRRRVNGESSGRRSRSPVTRAESGLGRAPSARRTGKSPGRVTPGSGEKIRKLDGGKECGDSKWAALPTNASNESIENPLVSLECFIFL